MGNKNKVVRLVRQGCFILTLPGLMSTAWMPLAPLGSTMLPGVRQEASLPDSPGATLAKLSPSTIFAMQTSNSTSADVTQDQQAAQPAPQTSQKPVGTAAAEPTHANGIAASQPAGVAIAPGKQHRVRTIVIATGAIIAAGIAVGSVAALTAGTSSRPPGAR
jgi:hypothetical protein